MTLRDEIKLNAKAHNRYLTDSYLFSMPDHELLCFVHPLERYGFSQRLQKEAQEIVNKMTQSENITASQI